MVLRRPKQQAKMASSTDADALDEDMEVIVTENGEVYSETGMFIGTLVDEDSAYTTQPSPPTHANEASISTPLAEASSARTVPIIEFDDDFTPLFTPPMHLAAIRADELDADDHDEACILVGASRRRPVRRCVLMGIGALALIAAAATPSKSLQRSMIVFGLLGMAAARGTTTTTLTVNTAYLSTQGTPCTAMQTSKTAIAVDTGASMHVSGRRELFPDNLISPDIPKIKVEIANNVQCQVEFSGKMKLPVKYRANVGTIKPKVGYLLLDNALYVPELKDNTLVSPRAMFHDQRIRTYFNDDRYIRMPDGKVIDMVETSALYVIPFAAPTKASKAFKATQITADELHERCMHFSQDRIRRSADCLENADFSSLQPTNCEACTTARSRRHDAPAHTSSPFTKPGECVCSDTCDMGECSTPFGFRYFVSFLDMATAYIWIYFLRTHQHAEMRAAYLQFIADASPYLHQGRVRLWFMDNGSEFNVSAGVGKDKPGFFANDTDTWLAEYFTRRRFIVPWNPQQNPAESTNRILLGPVRAALARANAPTRLWPFGIHQAGIVHNGLATLSKTATQAQSAIAMPTTINTIEQETTPTTARPLSPYQMLRKRKFDLEMLRPLFCSCECLIRNPADLASRPKAAPRTTPAVHLGLDNRRAGFFVYLIEFERFTTSAFKDTYFPATTKFTDVGSLIRGEVRQTDQAARLPTEQEQVDSRSMPENRDMEIVEPHLDRADRHLPDLPSSRTRSRSIQAMFCSRKTVPDDMIVVATHGPTALTLRTDIWRPLSCPTSTPEALAQDKAGWLQAYRKDFEAKVENGAFEFVERKKNMIVHKCKWAHKLLWNDDNTLKEMRARLVGCGYSQVQGRDFTSSYSSTPKASTVRMYEAAIACFDLDEEHCDVVKAFTQNDVTDVELYTHQPPGLAPTMNKDGHPYVIKVVKALEGFKQSGHLHQINHTQTFTDNNVVKFTITESEPTLLTHVEGEDRIMALIWTDDVHFAYTPSAKQKFELFLKEVYGKRWNYKRKGPVQKFVGVTIERDRTSKTLTLSMGDYITGVYNRFVQPRYIPRSSPYKSPDVLRSIATASSPAERDAMLDHPYLAAVASCIWIYSMLRADISFTLNCLCNVMHVPSNAAWICVLDLISYLQHSKDIKITYHTSDDQWHLPEAFQDMRAQVTRMHGLHCWVDASWKTPSVAGYVTILAGGPIDWSTKCIKVICHSSAEAEASAGCLAVKSLMYVRSVASAVGFEIMGPIHVLCDSEAAIAISNNLGTTKRTAHFLRWQHYLRWCVRHGYIKLTFTSGKSQLPDCLTKAVDITALRVFRKALYGA